MNGTSLKFIFSIWPYGLRNFNQSQAITRSVKVVSPVEFLMCGRFAYLVKFIKGNSFIIHCYRVSKWITKTRFNLKMTFLNVGNNESFCICHVLKIKAILFAEIHSPNSKYSISILFLLGPRIPFCDCETICSSSF